MIRFVLTLSFVAGLFSFIQAQELKWPRDTIRRYEPGKRLQKLDTTRYKVPPVVVLGDVFTAPQQAVPIPNALPTEGMAITNMYGRMPVKRLSGEEMIRMPGTELLDTLGTNKKGIESYFGVKPNRD